MKRKGPAAIRILALLLALLMLPIIPIKAEAAEYDTNERLVASVADMTSALQNSSITTIYLDADITMTANVSSIAERDGGLTIIGHPKDDADARYTYTDRASGDSTSTLNGALTNITFYQIDMNIRNYFGVFRQTNDNVTITFDEVTGQASQWVYGENSTKNTNVVFRNSSLTVSTNTLTGELVEGAASITFEGDVTINKTSTSNQMFWKIGAITFAENANVTLSSVTGFSYDKTSSVIVDKGADVQLINTGTANIYSLYVTQLTVNEDASLLLYHNGSSALRADTINIDNPKRIAIINTAGNAITNSATLNATNLQSVRYFSSAQVSSVYDASSATYIADMDTDAKIWWAQTELFDVSTSNWYSGTVSSTSYNNANLPSDSRTYATELSSSNFGVYTQSAYAIEIRGEDYIATETTLQAASSKTYDNEILTLTANNPNTGEAQGITGVRWLHESVSSTSDYQTFEEFDAAYDAADETLKGTETQFEYKSGDLKESAVYEMNIIRNGTYWAEVTYTCGDFGTVHRDYVKLVVDHIYTTKNILVRGMYQDALLYSYMASTSQTVGIAYDYKGLTVLEDPSQGYDSFTFSVPAAYETHWQATMKNNTTVPQSISLNPDFISNNTLCDSNNPLLYTLTYSRTANWWADVTVQYVNQSGTAVSINDVTSGTIALPLDEENGVTVSSYFEYGGRYTPPSNETYSPIGYYVDDSFDQNNVTSLTDFSAFDPQFTDTTNQTLYIVYATDMRRITERFIIKGDGETDDLELLPNTVTLDPTDDYVASPKTINGYVETGYMIQNAYMSDSEKIFSFVYENFKDELAPNLSQKGQFVVSITSSQLEENTIVTYYYEREIKTGTGIPVSAGIAVHIWRLGTKLNDTNTYVLADEQIEYTRKNYAVSYTNDDSTDGDPNQIITTDSDLGQWIFEYSENHPEKRTITPSEDATISFRYAYDSLSIDTADQDQYVTEQYRIDGNEETILSANTITYVLKGQRYTKQAPETIYYGGKIYHAYAYQVDGGAVTNGVIASFDTTQVQQTVTFLYREQEVLSVVFTGDAYLSEAVSLGTDTITGYAGKDVTDEVKAMAERSFDGYSFEKAMLDDQELDLDDLSAITLNTGESRTLTVYYTRDASPSTITVKGVTGENGATELYSYTKEVSPVAGSQTIEAIAMAGYAVTDASVGGSSLGATTSVSVDPSRGDQTVTFTYASTTANVTIRAVEYSNTSNNLITPIVTTAEINTAFQYQSPAVAGYTLTNANGAEVVPFTATLESVAASGTSEIVFYYKQATGNQRVILQDSETNAIIGYESYMLTANQSQTIPVSTITNYTTAATPQSVTWDGVTTISDIVYSYTRNKATLTLVAYSTLTEQQIETVEVTTEPQRVLEAYTFDSELTALEVLVGDAYTLVPLSNTTYVVQSEDAANTIKIWFTPKKSDAVTVEVRTQSGTLLQSYTLPAAAGETITLTADDAPTIAGYALDEDNSQLSAQAGGTIVFVMRDVRHSVTVTTIADTTVQEAASYQVVNGASVTVYVPYIPGYTLKSYQVGEQNEVTANISTVQIDNVSADMIVTFAYETVEESVDATYSTITVIGMVDTDEQYRYTKRVRNDAETQTITAINLSGYAVTDASVGAASQGAATSVSVNPSLGDQTVTFTYRSIQTSVTIVMQNESQQTVRESFVVPAQIGEAFSYAAPAVEQHYLLTASVNGVQTNNTNFASLNEVVDGENVLTFVYAEIQSGQSVLVLKEQETGALIQNVIVDTSNFTEGTNEIEKPDLTEQYYIFAESGDTVSVEWSQYSAFVKEIEYIKRTADVPVLLYDVMDMNTPMETDVLSSQRLGDTISVSAPTIAGYTLLSHSTVSVRVGQDNAYFYYIAQDSGIGTVSVTVTDANTEAPISGATVTLGSVMQAITDDSGSYTFVDVPYDRYVISVAADGYISGQVTVSIAEQTPHATASLALSKPSTPGGGGGGGDTTTYYSLSFDTNGGTAIISVTKLSGTTIDLSAYQPSKAGYVFAGWYSDADLSNKVSSVRLTENMVVYAGWEQESGNIHEPYISGYTDNTFRPDNSITRAEVAQLLYNISGWEGAGSVIFNDVSQDSWYYNAVTTLGEQGVIAGYQDGTFQPDSFITRAEFVTLVTRYANLSVRGMQRFPDVVGNHWAAVYIAAATNAGYLSGYEDGTFRPENPITRAEAVKILNAMLGRDASEAVLADYTMPFTDVLPTHWAYYEILEAAVRHVHDA